MSAVQKEVCQVYVAKMLVEANIINFCPGLVGVLFFGGIWVMQVLYVIVPQSHVHN